MRLWRRDRASGAEIGFYTLFIVAPLQLDKERGSPGLHATLRLGGVLPRGFRIRRSPRIIYERQQRI